MSVVFYTLHHKRLHPRTLWVDAVAKAKFSYLRSA